MTPIALKLVYQNAQQMVSDNAHVIIDQQLVYKVPNKW